MSKEEHATERLCAFLRDAIEHWDWLAEYGPSCPAGCQQNWEGMREMAKASASVARKLIAEAEATKLPAN